jgi:toxin ParE1/3/4
VEHFVLALTHPAEHDLRDILAWSETEFGADAADRYEALLVQALIDIGENPRRAGAKLRQELPADIYTYHLAFSRDHVPAMRVRSPRHFLVYRITGQHIEVLRVLHDSRDLTLHFPTE